jgi:hypothetical protein
LDGQRAPEKEVCYRVYAANSYGESPASQVDCTMPPLAPSGVSVTLQADGSRLVSWTDNSHVEDGYVVLVSYDAGCTADNCYYVCDADGCHYETCDANGCYLAQYQERSYVLPPNATSHLIYGSEIFEAVFASRDGGHSDAGTSAAGSAAGAASLSPNSARASSAARRAPPMRKVPQRRVIRR